MINSDEKFMKEALRQAKKGLGRTSPNPAVGAVVVRDGKIIAAGYHKKAGGPHAEIAALGKMGGKAAGGETLYVTLEPCNHFGRTPPCTEAILESGIKRLVVGMTDPNPKVSGGGCGFLKHKGLEVTTGILEQECRRLNEEFIKFVTTRRPFVMAKTAMTLDGWTAASTGHSRWITSEESRQAVHRLRDRVDGLMVGSGTVITDDPSLTTRLRHGKGKDPVRIIVDTRLRIPLQSKVLNPDSPSPTIIAVGEGVSPRKLDKVRKGNVLPVVSRTRDGRIEMASFLEALADRGIMSLLIEGGATLMGHMIREQLVDKFYIFKAPKIFGGDDGVPMAAGAGPRRMDECLTLKDLKVRRIGNDTLFVGYPDY